ncbi:MAG: ABC transporter substrate binding protein, partial [Pseudomonadota bacterium]
MSCSLHGPDGWRPCDKARERSRAQSNSSRLFCCVLALSAAVIPFLTGCNSAMAAGKKEILYIDSYHEGLPWSDNMLMGIKSGLSTEDVDLRVEHMDTKRIDDEQYLQMLLAMYALKFKGCKFDAIIGSDDAAFAFLLEHHKALFPKVPVVFCGVNKFEDNMLVGHPELTGVLEIADLRSTLEIGLRLHPQTNHVVVINDRSLTGQAHRKAFEKIMPEFATKVTFRFVEDWELAELRDMLSKLPANTIVFQMSLFRDRHGEFISLTEGLEFISKRSAAPIYSSWDYLVGHGIVGGMCVSALQQGHAAAEITLRILRGADPANIAVLKESPNQYVFDYTQLVRFRMDVGSLPKESVVINRPVTWYAVDKRLAWTGAGLAAFLVFSLVVLGFHIQYKRRAEEDLRHEVRERTEAEEKYRAIFENALEGIFQSTPHGAFVRANPAMARIFGYESLSQLIDMVTDISALYVVPERREELFKLLADKRTVSGFEIEFYRRDGTKIWASVDVRPVHGDDGNLLFAEGLCQDITDRKRAEEALREREEFLSSIVENIPDMIFIKDAKELRFVRFNKAGEKLLGYKREDLIGKNDYDFFPKEQADFFTK